MNHATAQRISVVGQFNDWDGRRHMMRSLGASGVWENAETDISNRRSIIRLGMFIAYDKSSHHRGAQRVSQGKPRISLALGVPITNVHCS